MHPGNCFPLEKTGPTNKQTIQENVFKAVVALKKRVITIASLQKEIRIISFSLSYCANLLAPQWVGPKRYMYTRNTGWAWMGHDCFLKEPLIIGQNMKT